MVLVVVAVVLVVVLVEVVLVEVVVVVTDTIDCVDMLTVPLSAEQLPALSQA